MTTTSTLATVISDIAKKTGIGVPISGITGTTTTLTNTAVGGYLKGPFSAARIRVGSPVLVTAGGTPGDSTFVSLYDPSAGQLTVSPAITTGATSAVVFNQGGIDDVARVIEACDRASQYRTRKWVRVPLTWVTDGDMLASGTSAWTITSVGTESMTKVVLAYPDVQTTQVLQLTTGTNASAYVQTASINVTLNPAATVQTRYFQTAIRVISGTGNAQFIVWDVTNGAAITPQIKAGSPTFTATSTGLDWVNISGTFQIPANCNQIAYRLQSSATSTVIQMGPLMDFPIHATDFPFQSRVRIENIGNFYYGLPTVTPGGLYDLLFSSQILIDGRRVRFIDTGAMITATFNFLPIRPVYYDELMYGPALSATTDTTPFVSDYLERWAVAELYDYLERHEPATYDERFGHPRPTKWRDRKQAAIRYAREGEMRYGPKTQVLYGREN